jgi:hypothetical protein
MAMRKSIRRELNKAREILHFLLHAPDPRTLTQIRKCYFCRKPILQSAVAVVRHGEGSGSPLPDLLDAVIHHIDGNHYNDHQSNKALAHDACHQRWHMLERRRIARQVKVDGEIVVVRHDQLRAGDVLAATKFTIVDVRTVRPSGRIALVVRHPLTRKTLPLTWRNPATTIRVVRAA